MDWWTASFVLKNEKIKDIWICLEFDAQDLGFLIPY
jgi:hypothetical protein